MATGYQEFPLTEPFKTSHPKLLSNDKAALSNNAGSAFPDAAKTLEGMQCWRSDEKKLYGYYGGTWVLIFDASKLPLGLMTGATTTADGHWGMVPTPTKGAVTRFMCSDGTWKDGNSLWVKRSGGTVSGTFIFKDDRGVIYQSQSVARGDKPAANAYMYIPFYDKNGLANSPNRLGCILHTTRTDGSVSMQLCVSSPANLKSETSERISVGYSLDGTVFTYAPTPSSSSNTTEIATTAWGTAKINALSKAITDALALKAPLASPTFTGAPTAPTVDASSNGTNIATTAWAKARDAEVESNLVTALNNLVKTWG